MSVFSQTLSNIGPVLGYRFNRKAFQKHLKGQYSTFRVNVEELEKTITERKIHEPVYQLSEAILWLLQVRYSFAPLVSHAMKGWITQDVARVIQPKWMVKVLERPMRYEANQMPMEDMLRDRKECMKLRGPLKVPLQPFHTADAIARTAEVRTNFRSTAFTLLGQAANNTSEWNELVNYTHTLIDNKSRHTNPFQISKCITEYWDHNSDTTDFAREFMGKKPVEESAIQETLFNDAGAGGSSTMHLSKWLLCPPAPSGASL